MYATSVGPCPIYIWQAIMFSMHACRPASCSSCLKSFASRCSSRDTSNVRESLTYRLIENLMRISQEGGGGGGGGQCLLLSHNMLRSLIRYRQLALKWILYAVRAYTKILFWSALPKKWWGTWVSKFCTKREQEYYSQMTNTQYHCILQFHASLMDKDFHVQFQRHDKGKIARPIF